MKCTGTTNIIINGIQRYLHNKNYNNIKEVPKQIIIIYFTVLLVPIEYYKQTNLYVIYLFTSLHGKTLNYILCTSFKIKTKKKKYISTRLL